MTHPIASTSAPLALPASVDLAASHILLQKIRAALANGGQVGIDASQVQALHLPGVQMLLAASRTPGVAILNPSQAFRDHFAALAIECATCVAELPAASEPEPEPEAIAADSVARPTRVLAIDDSKTMRDMLRLTLDSAGFDVVQAVDGMDGLDVLTRETVDVIITDINMPKMDGYGVIENLRGDPRYDATPILVLTTESDVEKKQRARDLGATGFIVKPFDPDTLVQVIHKVFPRGQK